MTAIKVLFITSELAPFSSTGGLAYVAQSFPKHLRERAIDARIIAPKFGPRIAQYEHALQKVAEFPIEINGQVGMCEIEQLEYLGNIIYFVKNDYYFGRENLYNYPDEAERFLFLNEAILQFSALKHFRPDIIHCNDWLSCLLPFLLKTKYRSHEVLARVKTLLSIRNLRYQGIFPKDVCKLLGVSWGFVRAAGLDFFDYVNFLKIGIYFSDMIVTSSPTYAQEIQAPGYDPLTETLRKRQGAIFGIVEGIDIHIDDPARDPRIYANCTLPERFAAFVTKVCHFLFQRQQSDQGRRPAGNDAPRPALLER
jgi:starch synthase